MFHDDKETLSALSTVNCILHVLLRYFHLTNFFWMFVEGKSESLKTAKGETFGLITVLYCLHLIFKQD